KRISTNAAPAALPGAFFYFAPVSFFRAAAAGLGNAHNPQVVIAALLQSNKGNTGRRFDLGQVNQLAQFQICYVDLDKLGQVARQAADFNFSHVTFNHATAKFHALTVVFVGEVQWNVDVNRLVLGDSQEVRVQDFSTERVTLQVFKNHGLGCAINIQSQNG